MSVLWFPGHLLQQQLFIRSILQAPIWRVMLCLMLFICSYLRSNRLNDAAAGFPSFYCSSAFLHDFIDTPAVQLYKRKWLKAWSASSSLFFHPVAGKEEGSSAQTSEGTMNEDERAALDCALYLERSPDVTGESPNDWDQSVGPDGTQDIDSASTINTTVDPTDSAVNKSVSHSNTTSSAVLPTDMPIVTQAKSWTTADEHSTVMPTRGGIRVDGIINASFELILHSADAEIFRPTEDPPSSPKSPISLPSLLTVTNEAGGSVFYNSACEVDDDALMLRLLAGLVTAILVLHLVNTMKIWYNDWKKSKYRHQSDRESSSSKSIRDPYNEELAEIVQPFQKISRAVDLAIDTNVTNTRTRTRDASLVSNPSLPIHKSAIYTPSNPAHSLTKLQRSYVQRASRGVHPPSYQERVESFETV
ncbi:hypothetical protein LENED_005929 [Lentinula edodes]|uniref:Uncharacterized protein n=1 Tax=Lentinula edodes TaxID=5353 RepID=A0A1Q3EA97_LENED|nr:hypothetical protein LENED_005929 [Lentinula edodes]